jgi:hypothetical protein
VYRLSTWQISGKNDITPKLNFLGNQKETFPASDAVNIYWYSYFISMHLYVLQHMNIRVTVMCVVYFYRNSTKGNWHKLFLLEKYSRTGRQTHVFHHLFSSRLMRFLLEWYYPFMSESLTHKMAKLTKNGPFWTNVVFTINPATVRQKLICMSEAKGNNDVRSNRITVKNHTIAQEVSTLITAGSTFCLHYRLVVVVVYLTTLFQHLRLYSVDF